MTVPPVEPDLVAKYWTGELSRSQAVAVETQLQRSPAWRQAVGSHAPQPRLEANWTAISAELDAPRRGFIERGLTRLGVPEHVVRLMGVTPVMRRAWLLASLLVLLFGLAAANGERSSGDLTLLLTLAPLVPVLGVGLAYGPGVDPAHEMTVVTPTSGFRLLLLRSATVIGTTLVFGGVASLFVLDRGASAVAWLLPALGLTVATLAVSTFAPARVAAALVGAAWLAVVISYVSAVEDDVSMFGVGGQLAMLGLALVAGAVLLARRREFETFRAAS